MTGKNDTRPTVSVVMSFSNEPLQWLKLAVESILNQSFRDFEFIVVCDNPGFDEGISYIEEVAGYDSRVISIVNENNIGPTKSFNTAISIARGRYIARMDADDISLPERFGRQVEYLDAHPDISVCATDAHNIDEKGKITRKRRYRNKRNQALIVISNFMAHPSVMFRSSLLEERNPLYNEEYIYSQDYELWQFLILKGHRFHTLEEPLLLYRKSRGQISCSHKRRQVELFKKAHRSFITSWLTVHGIIDGDEDLKTTLNKASKACRNIEGPDREYLLLIIYVLYFSLGSDIWLYRLRYIFDRNLIVFRIRFIYTFRLFVSSKTRRDRTGFN